MSRIARITGNKALLVFLSFFMVCQATAQTVYWSVLPEYDNLIHVKESLYLASKADDTFWVDLSTGETQKINNLTQTPDIITPYYEGKALFLNKVFDYTTQTSHYRLLGYFSDLSGNLEFIPAPRTKSISEPEVKYYIDAYPFFSSTCMLLPAYKIEAGSKYYGYLEVKVSSYGNSINTTVAMVEATKFEFERVWPCEKSGDKINTFVQKKKEPKYVQLKNGGLVNIAGSDQLVYAAVPDRGKVSLADWEARYPDMADLKTVLSSERFAEQVGIPDKGLKWDGSNLIVNSADTVYTGLLTTGPFIKGKAICQTDQGKWGQLAYLPGKVDCKMKPEYPKNYQESYGGRNGKTGPTFRRVDAIVKPFYKATVTLPEGFGDKNQVKGSCNNYAFRRLDPDKANEGDNEVCFTCDLPIEKSAVRRPIVVLDGPIELYNGEKVAEVVRALQERDQEFIDGIVFYPGKTAYADESGNASVNATLKNNFKQAVTVKYGRNEYTLEPGESKTFGGSRSDVFVATSVTFTVEVSTEGYDPITKQATVRINPY